MLIQSAPILLKNRAKLLNAADVCIGLNRLGCQIKMPAAETGVGEISYVISV
jgi:hypothetical protein